MASATSIQAQKSGEKHTEVGSVHWHSQDGSSQGIYLDHATRIISIGKAIFRFFADIAVYFGAHIIGQRGDCKEFACFPSVALKIMGAATQLVSHIYLK